MLKPHHSFRPFSSARSGTFLCSNCGDVLMHGEFLLLSSSLLTAFDDCVCGMPCILSLCFDNLKASEEVMD